jgi:hypothetical protein
MKKYEIIKIETGEDMEDKIYLTSDEFKKVLKNEIGHGTDGVVFQYNKDYLIKLYRKDFFKEPDELLQKAETKIYDPKNKPKFVPVKQNIRLFIKDEDSRMKLMDEFAIKKIIEKQQKVTKTHLPQKLVYVDGRFIGVLLKKVHGFQIHKFTGAPFAYKKKVAIAVIDAVKELLDNNIYHEDLANSPYANTAYVKGDEVVNSHGHSHILLNPFTMKVNIIDLDGKSTVYTDYIDKLEEERSLANLTHLLFEFLYGIDDAEYYMDNEDFDEDKGSIKNILEKHGIDEETASSIAQSGFKSIDEAYDVVNKSR